MKRRLLLSALLAISTASIAAGFDAEIKARQDAYSGIKDNVEMVGEMIKGGDLAWDQLATYGEALSQHSSGLKDLFPEGSQEGSNAKAAVWTKNERFMTALAKMDTGFQDFYSAAKAQDKGAALAAFKEATSTCKGCHRTFRVKK